MKLCPTCKRTYADESLTFCLADGSLLSAPYDPEATRRIPPSRITNAPTEVLPSNPNRSVPVIPSRRALPTYVIIALVALGVGGGIVALTSLRTKVNPSDRPSAINQSRASNDSISSPTTSPERKSELEPTSTPTLGETRSSTITRPQQSSSGTWFVILGSFPMSEYEKAKQRLETIKGLGYDATIIDTGNYPGLRRGLWAVVMGPYSKSNAKSAATQMKSIRSDAYAKSGW